MNTEGRHNTSGREAKTAAMVAAEAAHTDSFRREHPIVWWATLIGPFVATGAFLAYLAAERGVDYVLKLVGNAVATFFLLGRFAILIAGDPKAGETLARLSQVEAFVLVSWMDLFVACLLIFHGGLMFRIPKIGPGMAALREDAEFILARQPWMRRFTFIGLVLFVAFPLAATGSVAGSIFARLLGLSRAAGFAAIVCGTLVGNGAMFLGSKVVNSIPFFDPNNPLNLIGGLAVIVGLILLLNRRYQKMKLRWATEMDRESAAARDDATRPGSNAA